MVSTLNFYLDDSGARHPDRNPGTRADHGYDWFALGGVLIEDEAEERARSLHAAFCERWRIDYPLHSVDIRGRTGNFLWLLTAKNERRDAFYEELYQLMRSVPALGIACTVDRPGYNARYKERYNEKRWLLCKTAFCIVVERAAKYARSKARKLRVFPEKCNKIEDRTLRGYYDALRTEGSPFAPNTSDKYKPLSQAELHDTLYEFMPKNKTSPMAQLADLYLWPICVGGYHASNRPYKRLMEDGKLIECVMPREAWQAEASKYSCFDQVERKP